MTASTSEDTTARFLWRLAVTIAFAAVLVAAAAWQQRFQWGIALFLAMVLAMSAIRLTITRGAPLPIASTLAPTRETWLVSLVSIGMAWLPALAIATPLFDFAAYPLPQAALPVGVVFALLGLWLFYRSHVDLGIYWSPVLQIREHHALVTEGIYRRIRHPMYSAIFLLTAAQALFLGNWIAGPAGLIAFLILYVVRVGPEEAMMEETFGEGYRKYRRRTGRLVPKLTR